MHFPVYLLYTSVFSCFSHHSYLSNLFWQSASCITKSYTDFNRWALNSYLSSKKFMSWCIIFTLNFFFTFTACLDLSSVFLSQRANHSIILFSKICLMFSFTKCYSFAMLQFRFLDGPPSNVQFEFLLVWFEVSFSR